MKIAVIGGGWAGCAAALTLAEAGVAVQLFEAAPQLGGRARGVAPHADWPQLDNGQHILLGAYHHTLAVLERLHPSLDRVLLRAPLALDDGQGFALHCPRLPAPWHLLVGVLRARGLNGGARLKSLVFARRLLGTAALPARLGDALQAQPAAAISQLWAPLCSAALNTPVEHASTDVFRAVLRQALGGRRADSDLLLPRVDLGALFPEPAAQHIRALGGGVHTGSRVLALHTRARGVRLDDGPDFDRVIIATAPWHAAALIESLPGLTALAIRLRSLPTHAIATGYFRYPLTTRLPLPMLALRGAPAQFAFDRGPTHQQPGLIAVVASVADDLLTQPHTQWLDAMQAQLAPLLGTRPSARRGVLEKRATGRCQPDTDKPAIRTAHPGVFLAGDYTAGALPATLESAVLSGVQSALTLLDRPL